MVPRPPLPRLSAQSWRYQSANRDRLEIVGHQDTGADAVCLGEGDGDGATQNRCGRRLGGRRTKRRQDIARAAPQSRGVEASQQRGKNTHIGQHRETPVDIGVVVENLKPPAPGQPAQRVVARLRDRRHVTANIAAGLGREGRQSDQRLSQDLGRRPRLRDDQKPGGIGICGIEKALQSRWLKVIEEMLNRRVGLPVGQGTDGLGAETGAAGAEHDDVAKPFAHLVRALSEGGEVVFTSGSRQARHVPCGHCSGQRRRRLVGPGKKRCEPGVAEAVFKNDLAIGSVAV